MSSNESGGSYSLGCIILAAGANTRLTGMVPAYMKPLVLVNGRPLVRHAFDHATDDWKCNHTAVVVSPNNAGLLTEVLPYAGIDWVVQPKAIGVIDAISRGLRLIHSEKVLILCGDNTFEGRIPDVDTKIKKPGAWFGTRSLDKSASLRFTRWRRDGGVGVRLIEAGTSPEPGEGCWIGPLLLETQRLRHALQLKGWQNLTGLLTEATNGGRMLEPIDMRCSDMGIPEALS